jgi:hypothetical protein
MMERIEGISYEVQYVFTLASLVHVMPNLRQTGIDTQKVMQTFWDEYDETDKKESQTNFFLKYGVRVINPLLNKKLNRPPEHPTFNDILEYSLQEVIANDASLQRRKRKKVK